MNEVHLQSAAPDQGFRTVALVIFGLGFTWFVGLGASWGASIVWNEFWSSGGNALWCVAVGWLCVCVSAMGWLLPLDGFANRSGTGSHAIAIRSNFEQGMDSKRSSQWLEWFLLIVITLLWWGGALVISRSSKAALLRWLPVLIEVDSPEEESTPGDAGMKEPG